MLYPQNGDGLVTIDSVTSLHPVYTCDFGVVFIVDVDIRACQISATAHTDALSHNEYAQEQSYNKLKAGRVKF